MLYILCGLLFFSKIKQKMSIIYSVSPVCVSFVKRDTYIGKIKNWEYRTYSNRIFPVIDLLHLNYIKRWK